MKNQIKIYAIILGLVYAVMILTILINEFESKKAVFIKGYDQVRSGNLMQISEVTLLPKEGKFLLNETLKAGNTLMNYEPEIVYIELDADHSVFTNNKTVLSITFFFLGLFYIFMIPYISILFYQIIRRVMVKEVLDQLVVKRTIRMGWALVIYFVATLFIKVSNYLMVRQSVNLDDYNIMFPQLEYTVLLLGCLVLFLGQVLKISLKLKEEQDLTI